MIVEVEATSWRLRECTLVRELATTHRLGRMRRLRMLEEQKAWKREAGFDKIEITAEMNEKRFRIGLDTEPFYTKLYNPGWPRTSEEHKLEMDVDVERLRMEILLLQSAPPPQCDSSPQRSPTVDTGSDEPGTPHAKSQSTEREGFFLFEPVSMVSCAFVQVRNRRLLFWFKQTSERTTKQHLQKHKPPLARSLQDCRLADNNERQLRPSKASSLTLEGDGKLLLSVKLNVLFAVLFFARMLLLWFFLCLSVFCCIYFLLVCNFPKHEREARRIFTQGWERLECAPDA